MRCDQLQLSRCLCSTGDVREDPGPGAELHLQQHAAAGGAGDLSRWGFQDHGHPPAPHQRRPGQAGQQSARSGPHQPQPERRYVSDRQAQTPALITQGSFLHVVGTLGQRGPVCSATGRGYRLSGHIATQGERSPLSSSFSCTDARLRTQGVFCVVVVFSSIFLFWKEP